MSKITIAHVSNYRYLPAVLKENQDDWYIEYYAQNPQTLAMKRFRIRMNKAVKRFSKKADARKYCLDVVARLNCKLLDGWNPFFEGEDSRLYVPLTDVSELYLKEMKKELRPDTMRSYSAYSNMLLNWTNAREPGLFCSLFNEAKATRFMDYIYNERNVSARTWNNYLKMSRAFFNWCVTKGYTKENPFNKFSLKKKEKKERTTIDADTRKRIAEYLDGKPFLLVCMLVYHSLIRPKEIRNLRVGDIDLKNHTIKVAASIAKNHNTRYCAISTQIEDLIKRLGIMKYNQSYYIFSDPETMSPGSNKIYDSKFTKEWDKLRKALGLPSTMQLYSFRDTGIWNMLKSHVDDLSVMQHADHSSLDITTIYANHYDPNLVKIINENTPEF